MIDGGRVCKWELEVELAKGINRTTNTFKCVASATHFNAIKMAQDKVHELWPPAAGVVCCKPLEATLIQRSSAVLQSYVFVNARFAPTQFLINSIDHERPIS